MLLMSLGIGGTGLVVALAYRRAARIRDRVARAGLAPPSADGATGAKARGP